VKTVSDACIAIDNSGSVCRSASSPKTCSNCEKNDCEAGGRLFPDPLCCGNYKLITDFTSGYIDSFPSESTFSVIKFGSLASVISPSGSSHSDAKNAISTSRYTGGYTHIEDAILKCVDQLQDSKNPLIVLLTDGTPTACNNENNNKVSYTGRGKCTEEQCNKCNGNSFQIASERAADEAAKNDMSLIPVVISSFATDVDQLEQLARCPSSSTSCDVNSYKGLTVESLDDLDTILEELVTVTECAGDADPTAAPVADTVTSPPVAAPAPVDPGTFCHALNDRKECGLTGPGSCAVQPGPRSDKYPDGEPSCGIGVPVGYYPDLTRCDAYCYCTGGAEPSRYEIVNVGNLYDHKLASASYLAGKWGKDDGNGAWGTTGGIPVSDKGGMSVEGGERPPGCAPEQTCDGPNDNSFHPWNECTEYYQCGNGIAYQIMKCNPPLLFDEKISGCNDPDKVDCKVLNPEPEE
jgi:hypothetical protein